MSLYAKRLERGRFIWPSPTDGIVSITPAQLAYLLDGIELTLRAGATRRTPTGRSGPAEATAARRDADFTSQTGRIDDSMRP